MMFNNPYDRYNQRYPRATKYGPILRSPYIGNSPYIPPALSRRSSPPGGIGGYPYAMQFRLPYSSPPPPPNHCPSHSHCSSTCGETQATAHRGRRNNLKTNDVVIRGKAYAIRASYLQEQPKFEKELVAYMEERDEETVPDRVINLMFEFINEEDYCNTEIYDEVTLCILAHNAGAKSVVSYSLEKIKEMEDQRLDGKTVTDIVITILRSGDVPDKLKEWLDTFITDKVGFDNIRMDEYFQESICRYPETYQELLILLGYETWKRPPPGSRIL